MSELYQKVFSQFYDPFMESIEKNFLNTIRKDAISKLSGTVLEVGSGTGINFQYYNSASCIQKVYALEPSEYMWKIAEPKIQKINNPSIIQKIRMRMDNELFLEIVPPQSVDFILCTLVLCSIDDLKTTFQIFKKVLKPQGKLYVIEHIRAKHFIGSALQDIVYIPWKHFADGCSINKPTDELLKKAGFILEEEKYYSHLLPFYYACFNKNE